MDIEYTLLKCSRAMSKRVSQPRLLASDVASDSFVKKTMVVPSVILGRLEQLNFFSFLN